MRPAFARALAAGLTVLLIGTAAFYLLKNDGEPLSYRDQACSLDADTLERVKSALHPDRSGDLILVPRPGRQLLEVDSPRRELPLVFYAPGAIEAQGVLDRPASLADIVPTVATLLRASLSNVDGQVLEDVAKLRGDAFTRPPLRLFATVVWEGVDSAVLEGSSAPTLERLIRRGVAYKQITTGSITSARPATAATIGTGAFPARHGITGSYVRNGTEVEKGEQVDLLTPTMVDTWEALTEGRARTALFASDQLDVHLAGPSVDETRIGSSGGSASEAAASRVETVERTLVRLGFGDDEVPDLVTVHLPRHPDVSLRPEAMDDVVTAYDQGLADLVAVLDRRVGRGRWGIAVVGTPAHDPLGSIDESMTPVPADLDEETMAALDRLAGHQVFLAPASEGALGQNEVARAFSEVNDGERVYALAAPADAVRAAAC